MSILADNIKKRRRELKLTQEELATALGYTNRTTISKIESGKIDITLQKLRDIARVLGVTAGELAGPEGTLPDTDDLILIDNEQKIPIIGNVVCGEPVYEEEYFEGYVSTDINADFALIAHGDSMINADIKDGDIVFIKRQPIVDNGQIAVVAIDNEITMKRFYRYEKQIVLRPENPNYSEIVCTPHNEVYVYGKVVGIQRKVR